MDHYVVYHSVRVMGYEHTPDRVLNFLSKKFNLLQKAIGHKVWTIQGKSRGRKTEYFLTGAYIVEKVEPDSPGSDVFVIQSTNGMDFVPSVLLNNYDWFPFLLKSQSNFSLGFNRLNSDLVISGFLDIESDYAKNGETSELPDVDLPESVVEGTMTMVSHLRRERNRRIIQYKKEQVLAETGHLSCEACGFDFSKTYPGIGDGFCEVHHVIPLADKLQPPQTTLADLAIVCSNCHRIIHRTTPLISIEQLSAMVKATAQRS